MFDGSLGKKLLNLEIETREENGIRDEMYRLKIPQPGQKRRDKNQSVES